MRKKTLLTLLSAVMAMCLALFAVACGSVTVTISQTSATILVGQTVDLTATASDESEITWTTSDDDVATVRDGKVRGISAGTATITATSGDASASCTVTVTAVEITLSQTEATIERGQTLTLSADVSVEGQQVTWSSSDPSVASVNNGVITAIKEGNATITARCGSAGSASCAVTVTWNEKPTDYYAIVEGAEMDTANNLNQFVYWSDKASYGGSEVEVTQADFANGVATFSYSNATAHFYSFQVFYKKQSNVIGKNYKVELTINSLEAGDITVCGNIISLKAGENKVVAYYVEKEFDYTGAQPAASLAIQMGVETPYSTIASNVITMTEPVFSEYTPEKLTAPSAVSISEEKVVTVTDTTAGKASSFNIIFYAGDVLKYQIPVQSGDTIDTSTMESGTYNVKAVAVGSGMYTSSDESGVLTTYTVSNESIEYDLENRGEDASMGKWYYWAEWGAIQNARYSNGVISFSITDAGGNWYSNQIFYKESSLSTGTQYVITLTINVTAACKVTINGTVVDLVAGDNEVTVNATQGANSSFSMQLGTIDGGANGVANTYTLSNVKFTVSGGTTPAPAEPAGASLVNGDEAAAVKNKDVIYYWYAQGAWNLGADVTVTTAEYNAEAGAATFAYTSTGKCWFGFQIFLKNSEAVDGNEYKVSFKLNSSVAGEITVNGKVIQIQEGENVIEVEYTEAADKASLSIQFGNQTADTMISAATVTVSDLTFASVEA